jgi:hypothetical protein
MQVPTVTAAVRRDGTSPAEAQANSLLQCTANDVAHNALSPASTPPVCDQLLVGPHDVVPRMKPVAVMHAGHSFYILPLSPTLPTDFRSGQDLIIPPPEAFCDPVITCHEYP